MILQDPMASLNPALTVGEQIAETLRLHRGLRGQALHDRVLELLRQVRISDAERRVHAYPHQISGGIRQRVAGAIALSCSPSLLLADEPTTSLDVTVQAQYLSLLKGIQKETRLGLVFVTHDLGIVARSATGSRSCTRDGSSRAEQRARYLQGQDIPTPSAS